MPASSLKIVGGHVTDSDGEQLYFPLAPTYSPTLDQSTPSATITTLQAHTCTDNALTLVTGYVWARNTTSGWYVKHFSVVVTRSAGGSAVVGADAGPVARDDISITGLTIDGSGNDARVRWTGHASTHLQVGAKIWISEHVQAASA